MKLRPIAYYLFIYFEVDIDPKRVAYVLDFWFHPPCQWLKFNG